MSKTITPGKDTGIFKEPDRTSYTGDDMRDGMKQFAAYVNERFDIDKLLAGIERAALGLLKHHGCTYGHIHNAPPEAVDANSILSSIRAFRAEQAIGGTDTCYRHMFDLGALCQKLTVRPFEPAAMSGRKLRVRLQTARQSRNVANPATIRETVHHFQECNPKNSLTYARQQTAKKLNIHISTVKRACKKISK